MNTFDQGIVYFVLPEVLGENHLLALHPATGILIRFYCDHQNPRIYGVAQFTDGEMRVLLPLLQAYPGHGSHALLLAHYRSDPVTEELVARVRELLEETQGTQAWTKQMEPVYALLSCIRPKLQQALDLDIGAVVNTGYRLLAVGQEHRRTPGEHERSTHGVPENNRAVQTVFLEDTGLVCPAGQTRRYGRSGHRQLDSCELAGRTIHRYL